MFYSVHQSATYFCSFLPPSQMFDWETLNVSQLRPKKKKKKKTTTVVLAGYGIAIN